MAGNFMTQYGDLETLFIKDHTIIDKFAKTGSLWSFGRGVVGALGDNTTTSKSSPVQTVSAGTNWRQVSAGAFNTSAIKTDGTLWSWGNNSEGQLGDNTIVSKSSPVQTVSAGNNWRFVSCGNYFTGAIKTDNTLWMWGQGTNGKLGDGTTTRKTSPVQWSGSGPIWLRLSCGGEHAAAIRGDGTLWMWGRNSYGQLGDNTIVSKSSPVQTVSAGTSWKFVSCGNYHTGAIKSDGTLWTWGYNFAGQLGDNSVANRSSPVQTVAAGANWEAISFGDYNAGAIKTDGTLWMWGRNNYGQLADNTTTNKSSPIQTVAGGTNWKTISMTTTGSSVAAVKTDGTLWTWGYNSYGQLGDNTTVRKSSPVQTVAGGTNWKSAVAGKETAVGIYFYDANNLYPIA